MTLISRRMTLKYIAVINAPRTYTVPSLSVFNQCDQTFLSGQYMQQFNLELFYMYHVNKKIKREYLLSRGTHCTNFGSFKQRGQNIVSKHCLAYRTTDRCKTIYTSLLKRGLKKQGIWTFQNAWNFDFVFVSVILEIPLPLILFFLIQTLHVVLLTFITSVHKITEFLFARTFLLALVSKSRVGTRFAAVYPIIAGFAF